MFPKQVHRYLKDFFQETDCQVIEEGEQYLTVQLTIDMDKRIMNRPFYWKYIESTNGVPSPSQLTLISDQNNLKDDVKGEVIHFGSYRLNQLFEVTKELGAYVQMFERLSIYDDPSILTPYLGVNYKVSYFSDKTKETLYSLGINLMTGKIIEDFHDIVTQIDLVSDVPQKAIPLQYIIKPVRAINRLDAVIQHTIQLDDHTWIEEAKKRWKRDQRVLEYFYQDTEEKPDCYEIEAKALEERYNAKVKMEIINGGLFYLK
ncbi:YqhG family protein [Rummeliibacillus suwonensis]|uniref:YqhG family protein n=1 Tax=Rummeliibacillus suwonensis TaxID=1306154 RepID=UPI0011B6BA4A|nr:YqhG family protein [Rummeliibacillus suwonensis]